MATYKAVSHETSSGVCLFHIVSTHSFDTCLWGGGESDVVVVDLPLLCVAVEGSDNPITLEQPFQASLPPD